MEILTESLPKQDFEPIFIQKMDPIEKENLSPQTMEKFARNKMPPLIDIDQNPLVPAVKKSSKLPKKTNKGFKVDEILSKKRSFKCFICIKTFTTKRTWKIHTETIHEGKYRFKCDVCSKNFTTKKVLQIHTETVHEGKKPFKCNKCEKFSAPSKKDLQRHIVTVHEGKKPFQCSVCKSEFGRKNSLYRHMKSVHNKLYKSKLK